MQGNKYASMQVCRYASMQGNKYASMQVCRYASMQGNTCSIAQTRCLSNVLNVLNYCCKSSCKESQFSLFVCSLYKILNTLFSKLPK